MNKYLSNPRLLKSVLLAHLGQFLPDKTYIKLKWKNAMGYSLDFNNPITFNEKLQWLKLNDRKCIYTKMVDKYEAKFYVSKKLGEEIVIPTLGVWDTVEEINWDSLPNRFVLKCTHDSGGLIICKDKANLDIKKAQRKLKQSLSFDFYKAGREWPYKDVPRRIIAEEFMEDSNSQELSDFKIHCFNGEPKVVLVCRDRFSKTGLTEDFYDSEWKHLDIRRPEHPNAVVSMEKPEELDKMLDFAKKLSTGIPFLRVDFYIVNHRIYFGELTFYPATGMSPFIPNKWDEIFGSWITLPSKC